MRIPRVYIDSPLDIGVKLTLSSDAHRHVINVLRLKENNAIILFNGNGNAYPAKIILIEKKLTTVLIESQSINYAQSALNIELGLSLIKSDKFDFAIQKAVELGVTSITPLAATRSTIKLDDKRSAKKLAHWQGIIQSACEQSGRNILPIISTVQSIQQWLDSSTVEGIIFEPSSTKTLSSIGAQNNIRIIVGPEGGFTNDELNRVSKHNFTKIKIGPRILRAETAAITAVASLQLLWGDLNF